MRKVRLNNMEMFQSVRISDGLTMQKVPGGWIHSEVWDGKFDNTFIPYNKEVGVEEYEVIN